MPMSLEDREGDAWSIWLLLKPNVCKSWKIPRKEEEISICSIDDKTPGSRQTSGSPKSAVPPFSSHSCRRDIQSEHDFDGRFELSTNSASSWDMEAPCNSLGVVPELMLLGDGWLSWRRPISRARASARRNGSSAAEV